MFSYNNNNGKIYLYSLKTGLTINTIDLNNKPDNNIGEVRSIFVHNPDSIFLFERGKVNLIDLFGEVQNSYDLYNDKLYENYDIGELVSNDYVRLNYNKDRNALGFYNIYSGNLRKSIDKYLLVELNIETNSIATIPVLYPEYFTKNDASFGFLYDVNATFNNGDIFVNFPFLSDIYKYSFSSDGIIKYHGESTFTKNMAMPYYEGAMDLHAIENVRFFPIINDEFRELYYRFHWGDIDASNNLGRIPSFMDKRIYLTIFDKNLHKLKEIELPQYTYRINTWFVNKEGLFIGKNHPGGANQVEDSIKMDLFKFQF